MCYTQNKLLLLLNSATIAGPLNLTIFITFIISLNTWTEPTHWILNWQQRKYLFDTIWQHEVYLWITWNTETQYSNTNFTINDLKEGNILTLRPFTSGNVGPDMVRIFLLWYKFYNNAIDTCADHVTQIKSGTSRLLGLDSVHVCFWWGFLHIIFNNILQTFTMRLRHGKDIYFVNSTFKM